MLNKDEHKKIVWQTPSPLHRLALESGKGELLPEIGKSEFSNALRDNLQRRIPVIDGAVECRTYAVLVPLVETEDGLSLLYQVRSKQLNNHAGEIGFPGGAPASDEMPLDTALRETCEELLIRPEKIEVWGPSDVLVMPFNVIIHPFIAKIHDYDGSFNRSEVASVFTVPLSALKNNPPLIFQNKILNSPDENFPYHKISGGTGYCWAEGKNPIIMYEYKEHIIWGMTGRMTRTVLRILQDAGMKF